MTEVGAGPLRRVWLGAADRLGCTEGQLQTIAIGLTVALVALIAGLPPVLRNRPDEAAAAIPPVPAAPAPASSASDPGNAPAATSAIAALPGGSPTASSHPAPSGPEASVPPAEARPPAPAPLDMGVPGVNGACGFTSRSIDNPRHAEGAEPTPVWIYEPTGSAPAARTGGTCDDGRRPVVVIAHGFSQSDPIGYIALIRHLVSIGNIVVYPSYEVADGSRAALEESYRVVDAGAVAGVEAAPRVDTTRTGWWGHSHGGGMIPYLVQRAAARGWGTGGLWMSIVAQAYTQLVGAGDIAVPANAQEITVAFQDDALADARLGIDVFRSLLLPPAQKRHVTVQSGTDGGRPFLAEHGAPEGVAGQSDAVDVLLWRYADLLEECALHGTGCDEDLEVLTDANGTPTRHAVASSDPVDVGPYPAVLAECDAVFGPSLNPRIARCGPTRI